MPVWILKYWKFGVVGLLLFGAFTTGKKWEAAAYEQERAAVAAATAQAIAVREQVIRDQHAAQQAEDQAARAALQTDLANLRLRERDLLSQIDDLELVKPVADVVIEGCSEDEEIIANPFTADFVRVWNEAGRSHPAGQ